MSTSAPPVAIPAIAPVDNLLEDDALAALVALGIARVGDRDATEAYCVKYTARSLFSKPPAGAVAVAPPSELIHVSHAQCVQEVHIYLRAANNRNDFGRYYIRGDV
jgi:hypothetical protein